MFQYLPGHTTTSRMLPGPLHDWTSGLPPMPQRVGCDWHLQTRCGWHLTARDHTSWHFGLCNLHHCIHVCVQHVGCHPLSKFISFTGSLGVAGFPLAVDPLLSSLSPTLPSLAPADDESTTLISGGSSTVIIEGMLPLSNKLLDKIRKWEYVDLALLLDDQCSRLPEEYQVTTTRNSGQIVAIEQDQARGDGGKSQISSLG